MASISGNYEKQIENGILEYLNLVRRIFTIKLKDQAAFRDGHYVNPGKWSVPGVADLVAFLPGGKTVWIEVKRPGNNQTEAQKAFQFNIECAGHRYILARSIRDVETAIP